jgi:methylated-DNA-[protein]-cysteine S-methyltransferase
MSGFEHVGVPGGMPGDPPGESGSNLCELFAVFRPAVQEVPDVSLGAAAAGLLDVAYTVDDSPLGPLLLAATPRGLVLIAYLGGGAAGPGDPDVVLEALAERISPRVLRAPAPLDPARRELDEYFSGSRQRFDLRLDWRLAHGFGRRVLRATARIPYGSVSSYKLVATQAGSPRAHRAAGTALGANPLPIVVPCHRVLHAGGGLGGYAGGIERKRMLLSIEGALP